MTLGRSSDGPDHILQMNRPGCIILVILEGLARTRSSLLPRMNGRVLNFGRVNPRRNLPKCSSGRLREAHFVRAFERSFQKSSSARAVGGHEFGLNGYGIADFVWLEFQRSNTQQNSSRSTQTSPIKSILTAFEMKLEDWGKALAQAYRYRYFANRSIVVLARLRPSAMGHSRADIIQTFKKFGIGLWLFDRRACAIKEFWSPPKRRPFNKKARVEAELILLRKLDLTQPGK